MYFVWYCVSDSDPNLVSLVGPDPDLGRSEWSTEKEKPKPSRTSRGFCRSGGVSCSCDVLNIGFKKIASMFMIQMFGQENIGLDTDSDSAKSLAPNPDAVDLDPKQFHVIVKQLT